MTDRPSATNRSEAAGLAGAHSSPELLATNRSEAAGLAGAHSSPELLATNRSEAAGLAGAHSSPEFLAITPSQTVGPFFSIGMSWEQGPYAVAEDAPGAIWVRGRVLDGAGDPVPDAVVETWQTSPPPSEDFRAFTRSSTTPDGRYAIRTLKPGPGPSGQAPHLEVSVFARGLLDRVVTRVYFADEAAANAADPVLTAVVEGAPTLIATPGPEGYVFDIRLQGDDETVFFSI